MKANSSYISGNKYNLCWWNKAANVFEEYFISEQNLVANRKKINLPSYFQVLLNKTGINSLKFNKLLLVASKLLYRLISYFMHSFRITADGILKEKGNPSIIKYITNRKIIITNSAIDQKSFSTVRTNNHQINLSKPETLHRF